MSAAKHTPGPWAVRNIATAQRYIGPANDGGAPSVALVLSRVNVPDERLAADARLIAAAPELLDALEWLVALLPDPELDADLVQRREVLKAKAAIAKATGGAQ